MVQRKETCLWETKSWNCIFQHWHVEITLPALIGRDNTSLTLTSICGTSSSSHSVMHGTSRYSVFVMSACSPHCKQCCYYPLLVFWFCLQSMTKLDLCILSFMSIWQHYAHGMAVLLRRPISSSSVRDALLAENYNYRWSSGVLEYRGSMKGEQGHKNSWSSKRWTSKENTVGATASCAFRRWLP